MASLQDIFTGGLQTYLDVQEAKARAKIENTPAPPANPQPKPATPAAPTLSPMVIGGIVAGLALVAFLALRR